MFLAAAWAALYCWEVNAEWNVEKLNLLGSQRPAAPLPQPAGASWRWAVISYTTALPVSLRESILTRVKDIAEQWLSKQTFCKICLLSLQTRKGNAEMGRQ